MSELTNGNPGRESDAVSMRIQTVETMLSKVLVKEEVAVETDQGLALSSPPIGAPVRVKCKHSVCQRSFQDMASMEQHFKDAHATPKQQPAPPPSPVPQQQQQLLAEALLRTREDNEFVLDRPTESFVQLIKCKYPVCRRSFQDITSMEQHCKDAHATSPAPLPVPEQEELRTRGDYELLVNKPMGASVQLTKCKCSVCQRSFQDMASMEQHCKDAHATSKEQPAPPPLPGVKQHNALPRTGEDDELFLGKPIGSPMRVIKCKHSVCQRLFQDTASMEQHCKDAHATSSEQPAPFPLPVPEQQQLLLNALCRTGVDGELFLDKHIGFSVQCKHSVCEPLFQDMASMEQHCKDAHAGFKQQSVPPPSRALKQQQPLFRTDLTVVCSTSHVVSAIDDRGESSFGGGEDDELIRDQALMKMNVVPPQPSLLLVKTDSKAGSKEKVVACNDCGKSFKATEDLHMHQWDSISHTRVSKVRMSNPPSCARCPESFTNSDELEKHFMICHPVSNLTDFGDKYTLLATDFKRKWKHPNSPLGDIHKILKVYNLGWRRKSFEGYRTQLKIKANNRAEKDLRIIKDGNEVERYHGTAVRCDIGESSKKLCADAGCNLCNILRLGFKASKSKKGVFQRFGRGIYVSATSSKANTYTDCLRSGDAGGGGEPKRALLVCKILAGRVYKTTTNIQELSEPPEGYDSVCGEPGEDLYYDELVIYRDEAILPAFVILYTTG